MRKEENTVAAAMKSGFTLVELLVVVAILGILGTIAVQNVVQHIEKARVTAAESSCKSLADAALTYNMQHKKFPSDLHKLVEGDDDNPPIVEGGEGALIDPWDTEYKYEQRGKRVRVMSAGPDAQFGTEDDISSDKIKVTKQ